MQKRVETLGSEGGDALRARGSIASSALDQSKPATTLSELKAQLEALQQDVRTLSRITREAARVELAGFVVLRSGDGTPSPGFDLGEASAMSLP